MMLFLIQQIWIMPRLNARTDMIIAGEMPIESNLHIIFIVSGISKVPDPCRNCIGYNCCWYQNSSVWLGWTFTLQASAGVFLVLGIPASCGKTLARLRKLLEDQQLQLLPVDRVAD